MIKQETARHAGKDNINNYNPAEMVLFFPQFSRDNFNQFINDEQKDIRDLLIIANRSKREYHLKMIFGLENENVLKSYTKTVRLYLAKFLQETKVTNVENKMQNIIISTPGDKLHVEGLEFTQAEIIKIISVLITGDGV
jgi:hypothetical protein